MPRLWEEDKEAENIKRSIEMALCTERGTATGSSVVRAAASAIQALRGTDYLRVEKEEKPPEGHGTIGRI